jgi:hypothetical protein
MQVRRSEDEQPSTLGSDPSCSNWRLFAVVLVARKSSGWNTLWQFGVVELEAVATPIIKGTLVIDSEETT